ncbi:MAG: HEPN domain-containing protein [Candidatus Falkowbacteria bacterium]
MNNKFKECIKRGKIKDFSRGKYLVKKELNLAKEDLRFAKISFKEKNYRWSIVQTYYSMFHSARSLLFNKNYREHSHFCLIEALRELYVKDGLVNVIIMESFIKAKRLREAADYYGDFSELNANKLLNDAEKFIDEVIKIIN